MARNVFDSGYQTDGKTVSGRLVVIVIVLFAIVLTGTIRVYMDKHNAPFRPVQHAIAEAFPGSAPRVEGGQRKIHKHTPGILRIVMKVDFDPNKDDDRVEQIVDRVQQLSAEHLEMSKYRQLDVHLFWPEPEQEIRKRMVSRKLGE